MKAEREDRQNKEAELKSLLDEIAELEKEHARLRAELDAKKNETEGTVSVLAKRSRKAKQGISNLKIVHSNLDQHNEDLVHWQRYIDGTTSSAIADEYILSLNDELDKLKDDENAEEKMIALLKERFEQETKEMEKLLAQRRDLEKEQTKSKK